MALSLNKCELIGNVTKDPELRYTPQGSAVTSFTIATNRYWTTEQGEKKEEAEFHQIVCWDKLAELTSQIVKKGDKVFVEGRLQTKKYEKDGIEKSKTEIVIHNMINLSHKGGE